MKEGLILKDNLRYDERTVGYKRFFTAAQANVKISYLLRCPLLRSITAQDIAIPNDGKQYRIAQIQYPEDVIPPSMDLTLKEAEKTFKIKDGDE